MNDLTERMARAICREGELSAHGHREWDEDFICQIVDGYWPDYVPAALAGLAAIREPTEAMHDAARDWSLAKYGKAIGIDASDGCWRAMVDAARGEATCP